MTQDGFTDSQVCRVTEVKASVISGGQCRVTMLGPNGMQLQVWTDVATAPRIGDIYEVTHTWVERGS